MDNPKINEHTRRSSKWIYSKTTSKSEDLFAIADFGSPMSFLNKKTAENLRQNDRSAVFKLIPPVDAAKNLACYNEKHILPKGQLSIAVESGGWIIQSALFIIVDDQKADIMGGTFYQKLGSNKPKHNQILNIHSKEETSDKNFKKWFTKIFQELCVRIEKAKKNT